MNYEKMTTAELINEIKLLKSTLEDTESKRGVHELIEQAKRMRKLAELSMALSGDPMDIFKRVVETIGEILDISVVYLSEILGDELHFLCIYNNGEVITNAGSCPINITPCSTVKESKDMRIYHNVIEEFPKASFLKMHNAFTYCGFPSLDSDGNVISVSCLLNDELREFTDEDKDLLQIFAQRIGLEMERKKYLAERKNVEVREKLDIFTTSFSRACRDFVELKPVLELATTGLAEQLKVSRASVWLLDDSGNLVCQKLYEHPKSIYSEGMVLYSENYPNYIKTILDDNPIDVHDARTDPRTSEFLNDYLLPLNIFSMLEVPIKIEGKVSGVLCLEQTSYSRRWQKYEIDFADTITAQLSNAIDRITEHKLFKDRVTSFANILEESLNEIYIFDAKTLRIIQANKGARQNLGYSMEELSNLTPLDLKPEFTAESFAELVEPLRVSEKQRIQFTTVHRRKDGSLYDVEVHFLLSTFQYIPAFVAIILDITERKQIENERNRKSSFLQLHQIAAISANKAHEIEDAFKPILKGICSYTDWSIGHAYLVSRSDPDLLEPSAIWYLEDHRNFKTFCDITKVTEFKKGRGLPGKVMANGKPHWIKDVTKDPDFSRASFAEEVGIKAGFAFPVMVETEVVAVLEFFCAEVIEPDNQLLEVMSDVGIQLGRVFERKRMEEEHINTQKLESIGILAGGIAHDFNNSLQAIYSCISVAKLCINPEDEVYKRLTDAEKAIIQSKGLSQQLLTFSRGGDPIRKTIFISELIKNSAQFALSGSNVRCEFEIPDNLWSVKADKGQLDQVISNVCINANQSMTLGRIIKVKAENYNLEAKGSLPLQEGKYVKITIKDQGIGIPPEYLQKIFDPFYTTKQNGSGLGLATTYSIIKKHDGYISVESEVGIGTIFHIYLPASDEKTREKSAQEGAEEVWPESVRGKVEDAKSTTIKGRILLMDDETLIRYAVAQYIKDIEYEVETAKDGTEAIKLYKEAMESGIPFGAVILDLTIPGGMGGVKTIKKLLEIDPDVKAIVSSGYSDDPIMADFSKYGFSGVLVKPYESDELYEILQKMIMGKQT